MIIGLRQGADLHMAQLMLLPLTVSCFSKIQIGFAFLVPAHPGNPRWSPEGHKTDLCVCACVRAWLLFIIMQRLMHHVSIKRTNHRHYQKCQGTKRIKYPCNYVNLPSVLWHCWLGIRKSIRPIKNWVMGYWRGYLSGVWCKWFAYGPADAIATHRLLLQ